MQMVNGLMLDFMITRHTVKRSQPMSEQNMSLTSAQFLMHEHLLASIAGTPIIDSHFDVVCVGFCFSFITNFTVANFRYKFIFKNQKP